MSDDWLIDNRAYWDERAPLHTTSDFYAMARFREGATSLRPFEIAELGDVAGRRLLHLQCHFGQDTLSWARLGAQVTGLDFAPAAVEAARALATELGVSGARFVESNVYDAPAALGERFDVVYTGLGVLGWLPDIDAWARVVADLLEPGGVFYIAEFHPFMGVLDDETGTTVARDYFPDKPTTFDEPGSYADWHLPTVHNRATVWRHTLGDILSALCAAGLRIEFLHEHQVTYFDQFYNLVRDEDGTFHRPDGLPRLPLMFSIRATRS
jgi:SAM-dependent methyltransferase